MVLGLLWERPMHPYEMAKVMRWRGKHEVVRLQRGSLYPAVERLEGSGLVEAVDTEREGRRPERTVYQLTEIGRECAEGWLEQMLSEPANEFPRLPAALSFLPILTPANVRSQLSRRSVTLRGQIASMHVSAQYLTEQVCLPRLFQIEDEYRCAMLEAELAWVDALCADIDSEALTWDEPSLRRWAAEVDAAAGGAMPGGPYANLAEVALSKSNPDGAEPMPG